MRELTFFRLMLVVIAMVALSAGGGWAWATHREHQAEAAVSASFGDYNRYIQACGDDKQGGAWDLAVRANQALRRASALRDDYEAQADTFMWIGFVAVPAIVAAFYAFRWAMTGRVRPLWLL